MISGKGIAQHGLRRRRSLIADDNMHGVALWNCHGPNKNFLRMMTSRESFTIVDIYVTKCIFSRRKLMEIHREPELHIRCDGERDMIGK